jgi:ribosomal protein L20A (L18A)
MNDLDVEDHISKQYQARIDYIEESNKPADIKDAEIKKLMINSTFDPRRPSVVYTSEELARKSIKIQEILDSLSDEEFLTDSYVLNWHDLFNS